MEGLLLLLVVGFLMYYLIRHPLISLSVALQVLGLLILGTIGLSIIFVCIVDLGRKYPRVSLLLDKVPEPSPE